MPIIAASAKTEPATAPAMAPPLMSLMFTGEAVADNDEVVDVVEDSPEEVVETVCPKGVTPGVVVVSTVLSYPLAAAQPYP